MTKTPEILTKYPIKNRFTRKIAREYNSIIQSWTDINTSTMSKEQLASWDMSWLWFKIDVTAVSRAEEYLVKAIFEIDWEELDNMDESDYQTLVTEARKLLNPLV